METELVGEDTRHWLDILNCVFLSNIFAVFGIVSNVINIMVYRRQGLKTTISISLVSLAISDLCSLSFLLWFNLCANPFFSHADIPLMTSEFQHLTAGFPHACFSRITCWITVYITAERYLCVALPLHFKNIITPRRTTAVIIFIYAIMIVSLMPEYVTKYIGWKYFAERNETLLGLLTRQDTANLTELSFLIYAVYIIVSFLVLIILTITLVLKLKQKTNWRTKSIFQSITQDTISNRDKKTINMVIVIALVLIVCYTPAVILLVAGFVLPGFSVVGSQSNIFFVTWSFAFLFDTINSSISIVLYYKMSAKYRHSFMSIFETKKTILTGQSNRHESSL